ncbi:hypothetical protein A1O3_03141 [Capronia epimyces CBS 606.96]|uniref:Uncharacterized protein n=1 Tax=Capronia epimyces CBS 606.96 TaxID=1182542 RepID=W9YC23_9EURO|nr:uncharacterized protein A1O3_03141 [Capronia epimyces CBS 606.96]EXJ90073.1 hypothetical protein A1O3_03141 [Capronia epimyces CBS 606.96]
MPTRKSKSSASKGKATTASAVPSYTIVSNPRGLPRLEDGPPLAGEEFMAKNARAKALIMSTLVPGSEPWKIAEPLELASDVWKALEEKYAPRDASGKKISQTQTKSESNFIDDWVEGRPLDKYLDYYKSDILVKAKSNFGKSNVKVKSLTPKPTDKSSMQDHVLEDVRSVLFPTETAEQHPKPPAPTGPSASVASADAAAAPPLRSRWVARPVPHEEYFSEEQGSIFASHDLGRKKQVQNAITKVMMQKLPNRDLRLLWAVLYGGEDAIWPGSLSTVILGVTHDVAPKVVPGGAGTDKESRSNKNDAQDTPDEDAPDKNAQPISTEP